MNNAIAITENGQDRYEEYEELLVRRDHLYKVAGSYMTAYTREFGDLITSNFELKVECIKMKKTINYCRRRINRGLPIDTANMSADVDKEMKDYYAQLKEMAEENECAKKAESVSAFRLNRSKKIYRRLAKLIHPDINKKTNENEKLKELWNRITKAYQMSDADDLDDLEVLVRKQMEELGDDGFDIDFTDISERIERVEKQINDIVTTEPYTYGEFLSDEEKTAEYKEQLKAEHDDYEQYLETLKKTLNDTLSEGGATMVWKLD